MASEIRNRFTDTEMQIARETDLPELLTHLDYQVRRIGRYHTTAEMDSLRIKDRRTWFRYSQNTGGDAITFLQQFCGKSFPEAVEYLLTFHGKARDASIPQPKPISPKQALSLPPRNADDRRVFAYRFTSIPYSSAASRRLTFSFTISKMRMIPPFLRKNGGLPDVGQAAVCVFLMLFSLLSRS